MLFNPTNDFLQIIYVVIFNRSQRDRVRAISSLFYVNKKVVALVESVINHIDFVNRVWNSFKVLLDPFQNNFYVFIHNINTPGNYTNVRLYLSK